MKTEAQRLEEASLGHAAIKGQMYESNESWALLTIVPQGTMVYLMDEFFFPAI